MINIFIRYIMFLEAPTDQDSNNVLFPIDEPPQQEPFNAEAIVNEAFGFLAAEADVNADNGGLNADNGANADIRDW
jgi:hypothetical protein